MNRKVEGVIDRGRAEGRDVSIYMARRFDWFVDHARIKGPCVYVVLG